MNNLHHPDIFYKFDKKQFDEILKYAIENCFDFKIDILKSFKRETYDLSFDEYFELRKKADFVHDVIIHRKGYDEWKNDEFFKNNWCIEIGSRISSNIGDLFIFIYLKEEKLQELIEKYNLKY